MYRPQYSRVVRASDCQCQRRYGPGFDPSILRHSEILGAADEAVFEYSTQNKNPKKFPCPVKNIHNKKQEGFEHNYKCWRHMVVYFRVVRSGIDKEVVRGKEGRAWEDKVGKGGSGRGAGREEGILMWVAPG